MDFDHQIIMLGEVSADDIEVEVETSETCVPQNPLSDHDYLLTEPKKSSILPRNMKIRELKALYHCKRCGYTTFNKEVLLEHSRTHKPLEKPKLQKKQYIPCPSCNVKKPAEKYEKCPMCSFFTKKKASLKIHMRIHSEDKPYKCTLCYHRGESLKQLIRHYEDEHRTAEKYKCHKCDFTTHIKTALTAHRLTHGQAQNCAACPYTTAQSGELNRHIKRHVVKLNKIHI